jgi:hypothetical protein
MSCYYCNKNTKIKCSYCLSDVCKDCKVLDKHNGHFNCDMCNKNVCNCYKEKRFWGKVCLECIANDIGRRIGYFNGFGIVSPT